MKNVLTKRVIIIFSVLLVVVVTSLILALVTGNSRIPQLSNPEGVFYERVDENGKVIYTITNQEVFDELKSNDGVEQLLYLIDSHLLQAYVSQVTDTQIAEMTKRLTYGTSDDAKIAELTADQKESYENAFAQSMVLAGYSGNENAYARIRVAKEVYTRFISDSEGIITEEKVASEFMKKYFEDIKAIRIRFANSTDASLIMQKYNLVTLTSAIRQYNGYVFKSETLVQHDDETKIIEAYLPAIVFYTDANGHLYDLKDVKVYTKGANNIYTNSTGDEFTMDEVNGLVDEDDLTIVPADHIFGTKAEATTYRDANTHYYTVTKTNAYDLEESARVYDGDTVLYTINKDGKIFEGPNDVTATTKLVVNKVYKAVKSMGTVTKNNSKELTNDEVLAFYIKMYNDIYSEFRTPIAENATVADLLAADNADLAFDFETVNASSPSLASYMFSTLDILKTDAIPYTATPTSYTVSKNTYHFMVYKLSQEVKVNIYEIMLDAIEDTISLPATVVKDFELATTGWFGSTISWTSNNTAIISAKGVVTKPTADTPVKLTYKITLDGVTRTGDITVTAKKDGSENATPATVNVTKPVVKTLMNDDVTYTALYNKLLDEYVLDTATDNVSTAMVKLRKKFNLAINDKFIGIDYKSIDKDFEFAKKGDKKVIANVTGFPAYMSTTQTDTAFEVSADDLFKYAIGKSASLYSLYASQFKEILYSDYFVKVFGEQRDLRKNKSDKMDDIYASIRSQKMTYLSYKSMYEQYGISFDYEDFASFSRYQYGTKTEFDLLKYLVKGVLQPYVIGEAITSEQLIEMMLETVEKNYDNYFSLDVTHLIIHVDFDEDGNPDNYNDFIAGLDETELDAFNTLKAGLETAVLEYLDDPKKTFTDLINTYKNDSRDVTSTWGKYKNAGIWLMTESLNIADEEDKNTTHSLQYSGQYGIKDSFVPEYTAALVALYQEYQLEQNQILEQLYSDLVTTQFGVHLILANKGDDFERFSAEYTGPTTSYSEGVVNPTGKPTLAQLKLYAEYYMYSLVYDLEDTEIEEKYDIKIPTFPNDVREALEFYFEDILKELYVVGTLNIQLSTRLADGNYKASEYTTLTDAQLKANLAQIRDTYYDALFAKYLD